MSLFIVAPLSSLVTSPVGAQVVPGKWEVLSGAPDAIAPPRPLRHDDIYFVDESNGWLVNNKGQIYHSPDGGQSWENQYSDANLTFRSTTFIDESIGFAGLVLSEPDVLFETRDGGNSWDNISSSINGPTVQGICGMQAVSDSMIVGVGAFWGSPRFIRSNDVGQSWTSFDMSAMAATLIDVQFFDDSTGIVVGGTGSMLDGNAVILRTEDGGDSWEVVYETQRKSGVPGEWGWKISFPSDSVGFVSVEYFSNPDAHFAKVLKTYDQGQTWEAIDVDGSTDDLGLQGVGFIDEQTGWVGGRGTTSMTTDGGDSWIQLEPYDPSGSSDGQLDPRLNRIIVLSDTVAYATGRFVYEYVPAEPVGLTPSEPAPRLFTIDQNYPNPFNPSTTIDYSLTVGQPVTIRVFGPTGRHVKTLVDRQQPPGKHSVTWDATNSQGQVVSSGVYFYLVDIGDVIEIKKMMLIK